MMITPRDMGKSMQDRLYKKLAENTSLLLKLKGTPLVHNYMIFEYEEAIFIPKEVNILIKRGNSQGIPASQIAKCYGLNSKDYRIIENDSQIKKFELSGFFIIGFRIKYPKIIIY